MSTNSQRNVASLKMYEFLSYRMIRSEDAQLLLDWRTSPTVAPYMLTEIEQNLEKQIEDEKNKGEFIENFFYTITYIFVY